MKRILINLAAFLLLSVIAVNAQNISGGTVTVLQGGSTTAASAASQLVDVTTTTSGTTQSMFYTLNSVTIPASAFNGSRGIICDAWGTTAANANAKDFKITVGSATLYTMTAVTLSAKAFVAHFAVLRSNTNTQSGAGFFIFDSPINATFSGGGQSTAAAQTETSTIVIAIQSQNTAAAAASATGNGMTCSFL